ncbi:premelanosome protein a [Erpetoichthys calabaricus]|uniref:premelanosome protein a n=1 Tax=Erpetoichthys calabaricus TaxID=27687 RepID=UPI00109F6073|nr:premelanosome protein a [Erpetoichthys calabaricus]
MVSPLLLVLLGAALADSLGAPRGFSRYGSWNSGRYPVWRDGDPRNKNVWRGGGVSFRIGNDGPTLTGAKVTFSIQIKFPHNQNVTEDGDVVWTHNCTVNGTQYQGGDPIYPSEGSSAGWSGFFPNGAPFPRTFNRRKPRFVFVWQTRGKFWQVADGPSSSLTIDTDDIPLGSYSMEVVVYHSRGKDKFVPLGQAATQFTVTDQIPFSLLISQISDVNRADQSFIQNKAISFVIHLHDPSQYLQDADIAFNWDFGDNSGTLISRSLQVTHTYLSAGAFRPQVTLQASIPSASCGTSGDIPTPGATTEGSGLVTSDPPTTPQLASTAPAEVSVVPVQPSTPSPILTTNPTVPSNLDLAVPASVEVPANDATPLNEMANVASQTPEEAAVVPVSTTATEVAEEAGIIEDEVNVDTAAEDPEVAVLDGTQGTPENIAESVTVAASLDLASEATTVLGDVAEEVESDTAAEVVEEDATQVAPADDDAAAELVTVATPASVVENVVAAVDAVTPLTDAAAGEISNEIVETADVLLPEDQIEATANVPLLVAKRQVLENSGETCLIYRYGSFSTDLDIVQGIEAVQIIQVANVNTAESSNVVDLTVACQGSLPNEVCTIISDENCEVPLQTTCSEVLPTPECQLVLRQIFNDTGVFCVNVSLTNGVSLAAASAHVNINAASSSSTTTITLLVLGLLLVAGAVGAVAFTYRHRLKAYHPLTEEGLNRRPEEEEQMSIQSFLRTFLGWEIVGENRPLLRSQVV